MLCLELDRLYSQNLLCIFFVSDDDIRILCKLRHGLFRSILIPKCGTIIQVQRNKNSSFFRFYAGIHTNLRQFTAKRGRNPGKMEIRCAFQNPRPIEVFALCGSYGRILSIVGYFGGPLRCAFFQKIYAKSIAAIYNIVCADVVLTEWLLLL